MTNLSILEKTANLRRAYRDTHDPVIGELYEQHMEHILTHNIVARFDFENAPAIVEASSIARVWHHASESGWFGMISASRHENSHDKNRSQFKKLMAAVRSKGLGYIPMIGGYTEEDERGKKVQVSEASLFIPNAPFGVLKNLCRKFMQESFAFMNLNEPSHDQLGLYSQTGQNVLRLGKLTTQRLQEAWSQLRGHYFSFPAAAHLITAQQPQRFKPQDVRKAFRKKGGAIRWLCAERPTKKRRFKGGGMQWVTNVKGQKGGKPFNVFRTLGDAKKPKPTEVHMGGKRLRWC